MNLSDEEQNLVWQLIDKKYVQLIDANDTGQMNDAILYSFSDRENIKGGHFNLAEITRLLNIDKEDGKNQNDRFKDTVEVFRSLTLSIAYKYMNLVEGLRKFDKSKCEFSENKKNCPHKRNFTSISDCISHGRR